MVDDFASYRFPHLDDTEFPDIDTVDVYEYENDFDYERWEDNTKVRLCNVLWSSDYSNVVKFDDDAQRDAWFDSLDSFVVDLKTAFNVAPDNSTKIPVPYQVATRYNYLYVELSVMTSADNQIDYESDRRTKRFYYFVDDLVQLSPSTTRLLVTLDAWTTYINNVDIPYMMLERGHAPMTKVSVGEYLANPIANNDYLLAPDFDFSRGDDVVRDSDFFPVNDGVKYVVLAMTMGWPDFVSACGNVPAVVDNPTTPATYYDMDGRDGYQLGVNGYTWDVGGYDYSNANVPVDTLTSTGQLIPNGHVLIAIRASDAYAALNFIADRMTYMMRSIDACFVVDEKMVSVVRSVTLNGTYTFSQVVPANEHSIGNVRFEKSMFAYPDKYANIAKLYTSPYCSIEITDNDGNVMTAKVENTSGLDFRLATSLAYPYLEMQAYVNGVNGSGSISYKWKNLNDVDTDRKIPVSDFSRFMWKWDVPTYALYVSAYDESKTSEFFKRDIDRYNAVVDYQKSVRMRNIDRENAVDGADTTQTMTNNSANTEQTNVGNQANAAIGNTGTEVARNNSNLGISQFMENDVTQINQGLNTNNTSTNNDYTSATTNVENQAVVGNAIASAVGGVAENVGAGNLIGAAGSVLQAGVTGLTASTKNEAMATATIAVNNERRRLLNESLNDIVNAKNQYASEVNSANNSASTTITQRNANMMNANAANTATTKKGNAKLNRDVTVANATYTRNGYVQNAQAEMEQKRRSNLARYANDRMERPVAHGSYDGDATLDAFARRGLQFRLRTQPDDCIAQAGDMFLRYGYALNRVWDVSVSGLELMSHFTYWKCADIWLNEGIGVNQGAMNDIKRAFLDGVTIWREPDEVGKVSIYDNQPT